MKRPKRFFVIGIILGFVFSRAEVRAVAEGKPNILVILADDLGYHDLGCQGVADFQTPNIDRLAASGIRFTDGYVTAPQCGPSRAGLITGVSQSRFGYLDNYMHRGLPPAERVQTLPEQLKRQGYVTGIIGKWHIGQLDNRGKEVPGNRPWERGFDYALTISGGLSHYFPYRPDGTEWMTSAHREYRLEQKLENETTPRLLNGLPPDTYLTDCFSTRAGNFIRRHSETPWFLFLSYTAPHTPMNAKEELLEKYRDIPDETRRTLAAMMDSLDQGVGNVMRVLQETGQTRRTLVWFLSDNGAPTHHNASRNDPFSGKKGDVHEGGIRVPFMVSWPGTIPSGQVADDPVISLDILPTSLDAAGAPDVPPVHDGRDLLPWLKGDASAPKARLFWSWRSKSAVRLGDLKETRNGNAVKAANGERVPAHTFSNLRNNPAELPEEELKSPERRQGLSKALNRWLQDVLRDQEDLMPQSNEAGGPVVPVVSEGNSQCVEDDFDRGDSPYSVHGSAIGSSWKNSAPLVVKWAVGKGGLLALSAKGNSVLFNTGLETASGNGGGFSVRADVTALADRVWSGIAFNYQDADNFYFLRFKSGASNYQLYRVVDGKPASIMKSEMDGGFLKNRRYRLTVSSSEPWNFSFKIAEAESGTVLAKGNAVDPRSSFTGGFAGLYQGTAGSAAPKSRFDHFKLHVRPGVK